MKTLITISLMSLALGCSSADQSGGTGKARSETSSDASVASPEEAGDNVEIKTSQDIEAKKQRAEEIRAEAAALMTELVELKKQEAKAQGKLSLVDPADLQQKIADLQAKLVDLAAEAQQLAVDLQTAAQDLANDLVQMAMDLASDLQTIAMDIAAAAQAGDAAAVQKGIEDLLGKFPADLPGLPGVSTP